VTALQGLLRRERAVVAIGLAGLTTLAWIYIWRGAGMGMTALQMTKLTLFPHTQPDSMTGMEMPAIAWVTVAAMWWVMMIAMMTPSAAPLVLLHARVLRHANAPARHGASYVPSALLVSGYLVAWLAFSIGAAVLQYALQSAGLISEMMLWSKSAALSAAVLAAAGIYQLTPLKHTCLNHCRGPVGFLTRHWRPGRLGALAMGLEHGAWCVSCCWMLMVLLFVGGVMNLAWIALLAVLVLVEKVAPFGVAASRITGCILILWSVATLAVAAA
jgi:predicted metal-binding membrane protein